MNDDRLENYVEVKDRLPVWWKREPNGRIETEVQPWKDGEVVCEARLYREGESEPCATGWAWEREGEGYVNKTSFLENCETSAIGRALANLGITGPKGDEPRPSREEMRKANQGRPPKRPQKQASGAEAGAHTCPDCGGPIWDNRDDKKAGKVSKKYPNFKCQDREGCDWASWDSADEIWGPATATLELEDAKARVWKQLGEWIHDPDMREKYWRAYARDRVDQEDDPKDWDVLACQRALDDLRERGMEALEDLEPADVQGSLV